jgi:hypothetical protein
MAKLAHLLEGIVPLIHGQRQGREQAGSFVTRVVNVDDVHSESSPQREWKDLERKAGP